MGAAAVLLLCQDRVRGTATRGCSDSVLGEALVGFKIRVLKVLTWEGVRGGSKLFLFFEFL